MGIQQTLEILKEFVDERDWNQFHTPENLAKSISIEAAELLETFQWSSTPNRNEVAKELADVLTYCLLLAEKLNLDPLEIIEQKLDETRAKYPVDKARGKSTKYDRL